MSEIEAGSETRIPITEERLQVGKETVETGRVRVRSRVEEEDRRIQETLAREDVRVERSAVNRLDDEPPRLREEHGRLIVPVFEEVLVKRYRIVEEVHLITERSEAPYEDTVTLRRNSVEIERD